MNTQTFLDQLKYLAEAPQGVQKLRGFILQLAVQGKLVAQDPSDESALSLLSRIEIEKKRLFSEQQVKKLETVSSIIESDELFQIPNNWEWSKLGSICAYIQRGISPKYQDNSPYPVISQKCIQWTGFNFSKARFITPESAEKYSEERLLKNGDLLWNSTGTGTIGRIQVYPGHEDYPKAFADSHVTVLRTVFVLPEYVYLWIASPFIFPKIEGEASGSTQQVELSKSYAVNTLIPLPPIEEQKRIVAKVDQLMALCNQLDTEQKEKRKLQFNINTTSLISLTKADTQEAIATAWNRVKTNFDLLYETPQTIPQLRQTILQLAIQGRLIPQNLDDEPAEVLLEKISRAKGLKTELTSAYIADEEIEHPIPNNWAWARMVDITELITDGTHQTPKYTENGRIFLSAQNIKPFKFMPENHRFVSEEDYQNYIKSKKPEFEDVLLTRVGAGIGEAAVINQKLDFAIYVSLGLIRPSKKYINPYYLALWLNSPSGTGKSMKYTYGKGVSQGNLNLSLIRRFVVPIPPTAEQCRIVEKVNQLMVLCDQLDIQLKKVELGNAQCLDAIFQQLINKPPQLVEPTGIVEMVQKLETSQLSQAEKQTAMVSYIVANWRDSNTLGDIKITKTLFLLQEHCAVPLGLNFAKAAAGPFDKALYSEIHKIGKDKKWFEAECRTGGGHRYKLSRNAQEGYELGKAFLSEHQADIDSLMKRLAPLGSDHLEIIATLYAAWKNLLATNKPTSDSDLLNEFYAWSEKKKNYPSDLVLKWLGWMKDYQIVPKAALMEPASV